jgi:hypothetical protein
VLLSHRIESLEDLWSKSFSHGSLPNIPTKYSVKSLRGDKLFFESILPRLRTHRILPGLKTDRFCLSVLTDFTKAENSSDFTRAENWSDFTCPFCPILPRLRTRRILPELKTGPNLLVYFV